MSCPLRRKLAEKPLETRQNQTTKGMKIMAIPVKEFESGDTKLERLFQKGKGYTVFLF